MAKAWRWAWAGFAAWLPTVAFAGSVYLNGVNIDGVTAQRFDKATVRIDERGNVFIDAPGYAARLAGSAPSNAPFLAAGAAPSGPPTGAPPTADSQRLTQRYFLVTEQSAPGMTEFDIDVYLNSKWVRKLRSPEDPVLTDITKFLVPGRNSALLVARKGHAGPRKSFSPEHTFRVMIGSGNVGGENVVIDAPVVKFTRSAAEDRDISEEFSFTTR